MSRLIFLDSGPTGLLTRARGIARADQCLLWLTNVSFSGSLVFLPEIVDFEVRRELLRAGLTDGVRRLDDLAKQLGFLRINRDAMLRAAELWALARRSHLGTAADQTLDADCILAGQALSAAGRNDTVVVATTNVRHLARFPGVDAQPWEAIV